MILEIKINGDIWYKDYCAYLNETKIPLGNFNKDAFYDLVIYLEKEHEVKTDYSMFCGYDQTRRILCGNGRTIIITGNDENETEIVAEIDTNYINDFTYFDDIIYFERFYYSIIDYLKMLALTKANEI